MEGIIESKSHDQGVAFFPSLQKMSQNPYWKMLATELESLGFIVEKQNPSAFSRKWLISNRKRIQVLHIHFCQLFYANRKGKATFSGVFRFFLNILLARLLGYRIVFTLHDLEPTYWLEPKWIDKLGHTIPVLLANRVIVHCQVAIQAIKQKYKRIRGVVLMPHPNYISFYKNDISKKGARMKLGYSSDDEFVYTFFGGIRPNKGIENLIRAFRKLKDPHFRLLIAGAVNKPPRYAQYLQALAGADRRISFKFQWVPDDEIQVYMNAADVVVLPFTKILVSGSAVLALSFARPVIAPRMGCMPELLEPNAGWLFEPDDIEDMSRVMLGASKEILDRYNNAAFKKVEPFSPKDFGRRTKQVYLD